MGKLLILIQTIFNVTSSNLRGGRRLDLLFGLNFYVRADGSREAVSCSKAASRFINTLTGRNSAPPGCSEIKAAYLYNFINYIDWPAEALPPAGGTITIGIVGENPFGAALDPLKGKQIKGRTLAVKQVASAKDLEQCQIVFICASEKSRLPEILGQLKDAKLLTVSEIDGFAEQGGVINFISERNKVRFEINPEAARRTGLTISSELLKLAKLVKS